MFKIDEKIIPAICSWYIIYYKIIKLREQLLTNYLNVLSYLLKMFVIISNNKIVFIFSFEKLIFLLIKDFRMG